MFPVHLNTTSRIGNHKHTVDVQSAEKCDDILASFSTFFRELSSSLSPPAFFLSLNIPNIETSAV